MVSILLYALQQLVHHLTPHGVDVGDPPDVAMQTLAPEGQIGLRQRSYFFRFHSYPRSHCASD